MSALRRTATLTALLLEAALLAPTGSATAAVETCGGEVATIVGTGAPVVGTPGDDVIITGTSTEVNAGAGDDLVCVWQTSPGDPVDGGAVDGGAVDGGAVDGGDGHDDLSLTTANGERLAVDLAAGVATRNDVVTLRPTGFEDVGVGAEEFAVSVAVTGTDADNDVVVNGWEVAVTMSLGAGDDTATISQTEFATGPHELDLGSGTDHVNYLAPEQTVTLDLAAGTMRTTRAGTGSALGVESVDVVAYTVDLVGTDGPNDLTAHGCRLRLTGRAGDDALTADRSDPRFDETFTCQDTVSTILGGAGRDHLTGFDRADVLKGGPGQDRMIGNAGNDRIVGGTGRDRATGAKGRDTCVAEVERSCER